MIQTKKKNRNKLFGFFGINKPLFLMKTLAGEDIQRFVNREELLDYFKASIEMHQNCAVIGQPGTGKSSFLLKLKDIIKDSFHSDHLHFTFPLNESEKSRLHFLRTILRSLLSLIMQEDKLLDVIGVKEIAIEVARLEYSLIMENHEKSRKLLEGELSASDPGGLISKLIPFELKAKVNALKEKETTTVETKEFSIHNENTLFSTIVKLLNKIDEPIVLFIDELDKVGRYPLEAPEWDKEVIKILELSRDIMLNSNLILVFALQDELYGKLRNALKDMKGSSNLGLIHAFKKIEGFDIRFARDAVTKSLEYSGYKGGIDNLFEDGVIDIALERSQGNPRLYMYYLIEMSKKAFLKNEQKITKIHLNELISEIDNHE